MSKSILVIDTPTNCKECVFCKDYHRICNAWAGGMITYKPNCLLMDKNFFQEISTEDKPDWCPLKDVLNKTSVGIEVCIGNKTECVKSYVDGYNSCIDEILKGANGDDERTV